MSIIEVDHVTKEFRLGQLHALKQTMRNALAVMQGRSPEQHPLHKALDDVNFSVKQGEVLGIVGHNGAGKSTLLKLLAGITSPTAGTVQVRGRVAPLIEVGAGLVPDLTGRENIRLNATLLGMKRAQIKCKFDEMVSFAELEEFIDTPVKRYSSGMQIRLGFSIATSVETDILIVDEILAVGDLAFQRKCFDRMEGMIKREGKTVVLVSHNIRLVERICQRAILMERGRMVADGPPPQVCDLFYQKSDEHTLRNAVAGRTPRWESSGEVTLLEVSLLDQNGTALKSVVHHTDVTVRIVYKTETALKSPVFGVGVHTSDLLYLATENSKERIATHSLPAGTYEVRCTIKNFPFLPGIYSLRAGVAAGDLYSTVFYAENILHFQVKSQHVAWAESLREGIISLDTAWELKGVSTAIVQGIA